MARRQIQKALSPIKTYFNITVSDPYNTFKDLKNEKKRPAEKNPQRTYSIRELIKKQKEMTSPEVDIQPVYGSLRGQYLRSLGTDKSRPWVC